MKNNQTRPGPIDDQVLTEMAHQAARVVLDSLPPGMRVIVTLVELHPDRVHAATSTTLNPRNAIAVMYSYIEKLKTRIKGGGD